MSRHDAYALAWLLYWTVLLVLHCFNGCAHPPAPSSTHGTPQPTPPCGMRSVWVSSYHSPSLNEDCRGHDDFTDL